MVKPERIERQRQSLPLRPLSAQEKSRLRKQHSQWILHIVLHSLGGIVLGAMVVAALIYFDINRIGTMVFHSRSPGIFIVLMIAGFGSTFGMLAAGTAIYFKATEPTDETK